MQKSLKKGEGDNLTPKVQEPEELIKEVKVQDTGRQFVVQIPAQVVEALNIEKGDIITFKVPLDKVKDYSIKLKKIK
ncbi:hypothetical protein HYW75_06460 [Candidatus Pacearchaeota archaeon]|nr:hypothetical protein [Candidatus Pacearchaeota archaeon]